MKRFLPLLTIFATCGTLGFLGGCNRPMYSNPYGQAYQQPVYAQPVQPVMQPQVMYQQPCQPVCQPVCQPCCP